MAQPPKAAAKPKPNIMMDFGPLLIFFAVNYFYGIFAATASLMATMPIAMAWSWKTRKHIPPMMWVSVILVLIFGGLTIYLQDERFIKIKPTIIFTMFGAVLFGGLLFKKPMIKYVFEAAFPPMDPRGWTVLTVAWGGFFLFKAGLNEFVWRNFSTDAWVTFKTFGFLGLTFLFVFLQLPIIAKYGDLKKPAAK